MRNLKPLLAGVPSFLVPGFGQKFGGKENRRAAVLAAAIVIGNLNHLFIPVFLTANAAPETGWAYWLPRVGQNVVALWSVAFWVWVVADAYRMARAG